MKIAIPLLAAAIVASAIPAGASAANLSYSLTPLGSAGYSARWQMAANPTPTQVVDGQGFAIERVSGTFPRSTVGDAYLDFFSATNGGGFMISDADGPQVFATVFGTQLYTGSEATPTMRSGMFTLTSGQSGGRRYSLNVVEAVSAVPEPATWLVMIGGFGMVGAALRTRRRVTLRYA